MALYLPRNVNAYLTPRLSLCLCSFFFTDTAPPEIYTLSLHDALPIFDRVHRKTAHRRADSEPTLRAGLAVAAEVVFVVDRKSTRLNSSHQIISYAVFCLKKKNAPIRFSLASVNLPELLTYLLDWTARH